MPENVSCGQIVALIILKDGLDSDKPLLRCQGLEQGTLRQLELAIFEVTSHTLVRLPTRKQPRNLFIPALESRSANA